MTVSSVSGDLSGSVQIVNVSSQTSGLYRCSATNLLGTENCYVNLSIYSSEGPFVCTFYLLHLRDLVFNDQKLFIFLCSSRQFLGHAAGCAADLVHELGVAGSAGAPSVAPSHGTEEELERGKGRGVLQ